MGFKRLDAEDFVVSADAVQSTAWSTGLPTLSVFYTSSVQKAGTSGNYYLSVYQTSSDQTSATTQFDIAYGNVNGNGSEPYNSGIANLTPATSIYGQYRTLVLEDENTNFTYGDGNNTFSPNDFWAISVDRARYKEKLFPSTFNLALSGSGGFGKIHLTNNSGDVTIQTFLGSNRVYQVVSGSNGNAYDTSGYVAGSGSYGLFLPDIGTILLNPYALDGVHGDGGIALSTSDVIDSKAVNTNKMFLAVSGGASFTINSQENLTSDFVFVRARNSEYNYSANPSFISSSTGAVLYNDFINAPQTFITTVGLYNDENELLATAKLSKPLKKDFTKETLVRVKLDF